MVVPLIFFTAGLTLASSGVVVAQTTTPRAPGQDAFTALDHNKDGSISRIEATSNPSLSSQFTLLDQNQNSALEPAEFAQFETLGAEQTPGTPGGTTLRPDTTLRNPPPMTQPPSGASPPPSGTSPPPSGSSPTPDGSTPPPAPR